MPPSKLIRAYVEAFGAMVYHPSKALALLLVLLVARCSALSPDQQVLLDFKEAQRKGNCSGYSKEFFSSWTLDSKKWAGVKFEADGVVSALSAPSWSLCGPLPQSFGSLQDLTLLDLSENMWEGPLPQAWSRLIQLTALMLNVPAETYGDPTMISNITGSLPESFSTLKNLSILEVSGNSLSGKLPAPWSALVSVTKLSFAHNNLDGTLPVQWSALTSLEWLDFYSNNLTGTLPAQWSTLTSLYFVSCDFNALTGTLPAQWSTLQSLEFLRLVYNNLNGILPAQWSTLHSLLFLALFNNTLDGTLPAQWSTLEKLDSLVLDNNTLDGTLPTQWSALTSLISLSVNNNILHGTLPAQWSTLPSLHILSVSNNALGGTLPAQWSALAQLGFLSLDSNNLGGTLPAQWSALELLRQLSLARNPFPPQQTPIEWTSFWNNLQVLDMSNMQLTGQLPVIPDTAVFFKMSSNSLTGSISSVPVSARYVNLAGNSLTGSIPAVNSTGLVYLDLSNNQLSRLPEVFEAPSAIFFSVANNSLSGSIPDYSNSPDYSSPYHSYHFLAYCDMRNNSLTGSIPPSWTSRNWEFLALGYNKLSGQLPAVWEGNVSVLLLQNNSIGGCLPDVWTHNATMSILSLSNNTLACELPKKYASFFKNLIGIYLDGNQFTGLIPVQWMNGFRRSRSNKTVLYLGSMWLQSSSRSRQRSLLPSSNQYWRKDICLTGVLTARLKGLSKASIPDSVLQQLQSQLDAAMAPVDAALDDPSSIGLSVAFKLPPVDMQLSTHPQPSSAQVCMNTRARKIVAIQWAIMAFLLTLMVIVYIAETTGKVGLLSRLQPKRAAISLHLSERAPLLISVGLALLRLAGVAFYWFDIGTDIYLLRQVFDSDSSWAPWVLLAILLLHYIIGAAILGWYFVANRRYLLVVCIALVPLMPLVDTAAALMTAAQNAGNRWSMVAVDWQAVFELRHALEFLLESIPMAVMQTAIYVAGNSPKSGVYLDDWTYVLSASGTCLQILGMVGLVLSRAAKQGRAPWQVLRNLLTLPKRPPSSQHDNNHVRSGFQEL